MTLVTRKGAAPSTLRTAPGRPSCPWGCGLVARTKDASRNFRRHRRKVRADEQSAVIGRLLGSGQLVGQLLVARTA